MSGDLIAREATLADHADAIRALGKRAVGDVIEIGRRLTEAKKIAGHGNWLPWLEREFGWQERTAQNFMQVYVMSKSAKFADLTLPVSGLYLLAAPSTPDEARAEVIARAEGGEALSVADVARTVDEARNKQRKTTGRKELKRPAADIERADRAVAATDDEPAQAEGTFPVSFGSCHGGRVVTERSSTKAKADRAAVKQPKPDVRAVADRAEARANRYFAEPDTRAATDPSKYADIAEHRATFDQFNIFLQVFAALEARGGADKVAEAILLLDAGDPVPRLLRVAAYAREVVTNLNSKLKSPTAAAAGGPS
jgi:hypothetical protein